MNQKLEQFRRRYLNPGTPPDSSGAYAPAPSSVEPEAEGKPAISNASIEERSPIGREPAPAKESEPADPLAQAISALFEPARRYRDRVSRSFEAVRALQIELSALSQSVEPLKGLHDQIIELFNSIRSQFADVSLSLETGKALQMQLSELTATLNTGTELGAQIHTLLRSLSAETTNASDESESLHE
jgi:hypothetical protein